MSPAGRASSGADEGRVGVGSARVTFFRAHRVPLLLLHGLLLACLLSMPVVASAGQVSEENGFDYLYVYRTLQQFE